MANAGRTMGTALFVVMAWMVLVFNSEYDGIDCQGNVVVFLAGAGWIDRASHFVSHFWKLQEISKYRCWKRAMSPFCCRECIPNQNAYYSIERWPWNPEKTTAFGRDSMGIWNSLWTSEYSFLSQLFLNSGRTLEATVKTAIQIRKEIPLLNFPFSGSGLQAISC